MAAIAEAHVRRALALAERGWGRVSPNPLVGAVVVRDGEVVGEGWHEGPGTDHAEVAALRNEADAQRAGADALRASAESLRAEAEAQAGELQRRIDELEGQAAQHDERVRRAQQKIKADERLREKTRKALAMVLQILEDRPGGDGGSAPPAAP